MENEKATTQLSDHRELGLVPGAFDHWDDARLHDPGDDRAELWHFDGQLSNGATVALAFCIVGIDPVDSSMCRTVVNVMITMADGHQSVHAIPGTVKASTIGTTLCRLPFGLNHVEGDLASYDVHVDTGDGELTLDLHYQACTEPYRPRGSGYVALEDDRRTFLADLIVPRCSIAGTMTLDGEQQEVSGEGYHDHQWFNSNPLTTWHHWLWGHLYTEAFTVVVFDLVASETFGFTRTPLFGVFDAEGKLIFDNTGPAETTTTTYVESPSEKELPRESTYVFRDDSRTFVLRFEWVQVLVARDLYGSSDESDGAELGGASRKQFDEMRVEPFYARYLAQGSLEVTDTRGSTRQSGEMIYEFNYPARPDPRVPLSTS